jgi:hypothetical protein
MSQVYVANHTQRSWHFQFRLPENPKIQQLELRPGTQGKIPGDYDGRELESVLAQLHQAGGVPANDPKSLNSTFGMVYSVGAPVKSGQIDTAREQDVVVRQELAGDKAIEAGKATFATAEAHLERGNGRLGETSLEVTQMQDTEQGGPVKGGVSMETVVSTTQAPSQTGNRGRGRRGK